MAKEEVVSPEQLPENVDPLDCVVDGQEQVGKVSQEPGGAKRDSYFKRRDYK
jgi:hypothetical protein